MEVYKCDRCGKIYENSTSTLSGYQVVERALSMDLTSTSTEPAKINLEADLCCDCLDALELFMFNYDIVPPPEDKTV